MKVAVISQPFECIAPPAQASSIAIWTDRVINAFAGRPADFVIYSRLFPTQLAQEWYNKIEYRRVPDDIDDLIAKPLKLFERLLRYPFPKRPFFASTLNYFFYIYRIARDLQRVKPDIIHVHNFSQFVPVLHHFNPKAKIVLHMACEWLSQLDHKTIARRLKDTDLVITCSEYTTGRVRERFPEFAERCHTVYNGVDLHKFSSDGKKDSPAQNTPRRLLFVGRVSPEKGVHVLIKAMERVLVEYPNVELNVVGPAGSAPYEYMVMMSDDPKVNQLAGFYSGRLYKDHYYAALQTMASPWQQNIHFTGAVPHSDTIAYYKNADILINPSLTEAFGMSLVEAMASQVPVIASRVGGMTEVIDEQKTGLLVESDNPEALADAIIHLLRDEQLRISMGLEGLKQVTQRYSWDCIAESLWEQYAKLYDGEK